MRLRIWIIVLSILMTAQGALYAQQATVVGTVVDESKAVLPGVTVTATDLATGRPFVAVTEARGEFRLPGMEAGKYKIQAQLAGFATTTVAELELLVGQNATVNFVMKVANISESVTVNGEAPLVDTRSAQVAGNVDRRQMEALPIQGRNWMELSLMVKGVTGNDVSSNRAGGVAADSQFQLNLDGQQITEQVAGSSFGQPGLSRDAIAEYQIVTNLFDVTMGRSAGLQVQAISKSGGNTLAGSLYGYFRDDKFNAPDFVANRVLPYSDQQTGGTLGGPIVKDKAQYFVSYEHEREPNTVIVQPPRYTQTLSFPTKNSTDNVLGRVDYQLFSKDHLMVRGTTYRRQNPFDQVTQTTYPSQAASRTQDSEFVTANWSRVIRNNLLQEIKGGFYHYHWFYNLAPETAVVPTYAFPGFQIGTRNNYPEEFWESTPSLRYDLLWHKAAHDVKLGAEYVGIHDTDCWKNMVRGAYTFRTLPADVERRFPLDAWNDPSRWDFSGLDSSVIFFNKFVAKEGGQVNGCGDWSMDLPRPSYAFWLGDTWVVNNALTINGGIRYDLPWGDLTTPGVRPTDLVINNGLFTENVGYDPNRRELTDVSPRVGFAWNVNGKNDLVIRGGSGIFRGQNTSYYQLYQQTQNAQRVLVNSWTNDGQPGFIQDPTRGVTTDQILAGAVPLAPQALYIIARDYKLPYTVQSTIGGQKRVNDTTSVDADLVYWKIYNLDDARDPNLFYDPATGFNKNPVQFGRPAPQYGTMTLWESKGKADYLALATSLTRRYRNHFQGTLTYTLMFFKNDTGYGFVPTPNNPFDLDAEWARSLDFQRNTVRANSIVDLPWDITLAGSFLYGSGNYFPVTSGANPYGSSSLRTLPDLTIIPRNSLKGLPLQKLDLRFAKTLRLAGRTKLSGIAEVFNVYNHANYGSYNGLVTSPTYGQPLQNSATAYFPRIWQFGLRMSF